MNPSNNTYESLLMNIKFITEKPGTTNVPRKVLNTVYNLNILATLSQDTRIQIMKKANTSIQISLVSEYCHNFNPTWQSHPNNCIVNTLTAFLY